MLPDSAWGKTWHGKRPKSFTQLRKNSASKNEHFGGLLGIYRQPGKSNSGSLSLTQAQLYWTHKYLGVIF
jgi:hypothetical protein